MQDTNFLIFQDFIQHIELLNFKSLQLYIYFYLKHLEKQKTVKNIKYYDKLLISSIMLRAIIEKVKKGARYNENG